MEVCNKCGCRLTVLEGSYRSDIGSTDIYLDQHLICSNRECENSKNSIVLDTIVHKLN